jgi:hypothetical protein
VTSHPAAAAAPGWYADPYRHAAQRWFDGHGWTAHTHPRAPVTATAPVASVVPGIRRALPPTPVGVEYWLVPVGRSWQAVAAPWAGLVSLLFSPLGVLVLPLVAATIALAVWALCLPRDPAHPGRGRPVVAIVLGALAAVAGLATVLLPRL